MAKHRSDVDVQPQIAVTTVEALVKGTVSSTDDDELRRQKHPINGFSLGVSVVGGWRAVSVMPGEDSFMEI